VLPELLISQEKTHIYIFMSNQMFKYWQVIIFSFNTELVELIRGQRSLICDFWPSGKRERVQNLVWRGMWEHRQPHEARSQPPGGAQGFLPRITPITLHPNGAKIQGEAHLKWQAKLSKAVRSRCQGLFRFLLGIQYWGCGSCLSDPWCLGAFE
jgi:hypothetical protein